MGKAHFGTVDGAIAGGFDDSEEGRKIRVQYYVVDELLNNSQRGYIARMQAYACRLTHLYRVHLGNCPRSL